MATFHERLAKLLDVARDQGILDEGRAAALLELSGHGEPPPRMGKLAVSIAVLGGLGLALGVILIFAANWNSISDWVKLAGLLVLFAAAHLGGLWLRHRKPDYPASAETLSFLGGGLFLTGLALVTQIYHINEDPARGLMAWLLATLPLALLLRSAPLTGMAMLAALAWGHLVYYRQARIQEVDLGTSCIFEVFVALVLLGLAPLLGRLKASLARPLEVAATVVLAALVYLLGFFRYADNAFYRSPWRLEAAEHWAGGHIALLAGVALAFALATALLRPGLDGSRRLILFALLGATVALGAVASALWLGLIHPGAPVDFFGFGRFRHEAWHTRTFAVTAGAWILWFGWCLWLIFDGGLSGDGSVLAAGVYGFGIGVVTRFIDLIGTLLETGVAFVIGGAVLIVVGIGVEKWRRKLKQKLVPEKSPS